MTAARRIPAGRATDDERWVLVADRDGTDLRFEPNVGAPAPSQPLMAGDQFMFDSAEGSYPGYRAFRVTADDAAGDPAPILVGRYYHTGNASNVLKGGSSFEVERPVTYWRNEYWFSGMGAAKNRVQLIIPQGESPLLDGAPISGPLEASLPGYDVVSVAISRGLHHLTASTPFSLLVYGYTDGQPVPPTNAYGYVGPLGFGDQFAGCGD